jgi:hypothetical protein
MVNKRYENIAIIPTISNLWTTHRKRFSEYWKPSVDRLHKNSDSKKQTLIEFAANSRSLKI